MNFRVTCYTAPIWYYCKNILVKGNVLFAELSAVFIFVFFMVILYSE